MKNEIKCTGNNGNGCFGDSCGHNCGCDGIAEAHKRSTAVCKQGNIARISILTPGQWQSIIDFKEKLIISALTDYLKRPPTDDDFAKTTLNPENGGEELFYNEEKIGSLPAFSNKFISI